MTRQDLKKHLISFSIAAVLASTNQDLKASTKSENRPCPHAKKVTTYNIHHGVQGRVAPHTSAHGPFIYADFLYWQAKEDGLEYATAYRVSPSTGFVASAKNKEIDFNWKPGFRAALGYIFGENEAWDLTGTYTYYRTHSHTSSGPFSIDSRPLTALWAPSILGPLATTAKAEWNLSYNIADLDLGRNYFVSRKLALHPYLGLRGAFIYQHYRANYTGVYQTDTSSFSNKTKMSADNDFTAGGIRAGADFLWHFGSHIGLYGGMSGSILYGQFRIPQRFYGFRVADVEDVNALTAQNISLSGRSMRTRANIDAIIGLFWETMIRKWGHHIMLNVGYELSHWFDQNMLRQLVTSFDSQPLAGGSVSNTTGRSFISQEGDLGLQGLTVRLRYEF